jgi:hypothetical protein
MVKNFYFPQFLVVFFFSVSVFCGNLKAQEADSIISAIENLESNADKLVAVYQNTSRLATVDPSKLPKLALITKRANPKLSDKNALGHWYSILGHYHATAGDSDSIMYYRQKAVAAFRNQPPSRQKANAFNSISASYYYQGNLEKYLASNDSAYKVLASLPKEDKAVALMVLFNRTMVLFELNKPTEAYNTLKQIEQDLASTKHNGFKGKLALRLYYYFTHYEANPDSSLFYALKSLRYAKQTKSKSYQASSFSAIGTAYSSVKKYKLANQYLDSALAANKGLNDNETYVSLLYDRLLNYDHQGDDANADATWRRAMQAINEQGLAHWKHPFYDERHRFFEAQGEYKLALEAYKIFKALDDSIKGVELKESLAEMEVKYEVAEKDAQLALLAYEKEQAAAKNKLIYVSGGMAVVVLLLILLFTNRNNKLTKTLTQQKQKTLELEIVNKQQEERRLKSENEYQKKQLSTRALEVSQRNRVLIDVFEKLETLKQKESYGQQELITKLHAEVRSYLRSSEDWKRIRVHLEEVNSVLIQGIKAVHPHLTAKDLRLLMLFKIGLNTKEIANLLNLAPNSVKMSRYRLKKKLELDEEANLDAYLAKFEKDSTFSM